MTAMSNVVVLDDFRPRVWEYLHCKFCGAKGKARVIVDRKYYPCPTDNCEETAAVPTWSDEQR
jgi:hypothetical protein